MVDKIIHIPHDRFIQIYELSLILPSWQIVGWKLDGESITAEELADKIKAQYEKFSFFREPTWYKVNSLWDMGTYFFNLFDNFPIKEERGLQETGKTKTMNVSKNMSFNSTDIMINPSEATLFRETHDKRIYFRPFLILELLNHEC